MNTDNNKSIEVKELLDAKGEDLKLSLIAGSGGLDREIERIDPYRPGLAVSGYTEHFRHQNIQVLGKTEIQYIKSLSTKKRSANLKNMMKFELPCIIISRGIDPPRMLKILANRHSIPLIVSELDTPQLIHSISIHLNNVLAPETTMHGTLVDIYGVGVLLTGVSGIGKSETALDLVDRGHRLVADDAIKIFKKGEHVLMGTGIAPESALQYHMEVRGIGILDIAKIYGIRSVRLHKRVEIEIELIKWEPDLNIERVGIKEDNTDILDVEIPLIKVPLLPGKNIAVIIEVVALNHILKISGYDTAKIFNATLIKLMQKRAKNLARLEEDEE
ncbi:MAG: HPr(Ser) kinase/phosphatase [candidate division WOR-3 bacterium]|nr:HPr(Ser) kinase/phosphatase [candidate division WOR-3 bacterium]